MATSDCNAAAMAVALPGVSSLLSNAQHYVLQNRRGELGVVTG